MQMSEDIWMLIQTLGLKSANGVAVLLNWSTAKVLRSRTMATADVELVRITLQSACLLRYEYELSPEQAVYHLNNALVKSEFDDDPDYEFHSLITGIKLLAEGHLMNRSVYDLTKEAVESEKAEQAKRLKVIIPTEIAPEAQFEKLMDELEAALGAIEVTPKIESAFRNLEQAVRKLYV